MDCFGFQPRNDEGFRLAMAKIFSFCNDEGFSLAMKMLKPRNDDCFNVNENPCNSYRSF